uniref:Orf c04026 protein n=1 Tax=Saccharolobus solfataricus TaxID=2287 RepID=P95965_SACSO|nr:orf c04026 [Saccharolobus solfataricus P2]
MLIFTITASIGMLYFTATLSMLIFSGPGSPIATPVPSAIAPVFSPSNFNAASMVIILVTLPLYSSTTFSTASPGLPTVAMGPSAFTTINFLPSNSTSPATVSLLGFHFLSAFINR